MKKINFKDHFSSSAGIYKKYRPVYPVAMFEYFASIAPSAKSAWDCATGSGQAAGELARCFDQVIATDASRQQIENAKRIENVLYSVAHAEEAPIKSESVDLITVAQALHWFDSKRFFHEAKRVLKGNGIIAVWSYNLLSVTPEIDQAINAFYKETIGPYWPPERRLVEEGYKNIAFPFTAISCPEFSMSAVWTLENLMGYLSTWSAVKRYKEQNGFNPVEAIQEELAEKWGNPADKHKITWPLTVILGKNINGRQSGDPLG